MKRILNKNKFKYALLTTVIALFVLISASFSSKAKPSNKLYIVATTSQIGDLVQNIVGDSAKVHFLMGSGIDPHLYHPTRSDVSKLMKADIVVYNGLNLEGKMEHFLEELGETKTTLSIADFLNEDRVDTTDPHIWMDVGNWIKASDGITATLKDIYPNYTKTYTTNHTSYKAKLSALNGWVDETLKTIPDNNRVLVTAHDAFGYLGRAYNIDVIGIQGISTESEAGLQKIDELVTALTDNKIPSVFIETSVGDHNIRAVIEGAKARGADVGIGGKLYSDAMGAAGTYHGTYIGMMTYNVTTITNSLGGHVANNNAAHVSIKSNTIME